MTARTSGAIALQPIGNIQGTQFFLNINSSRWVAHNNWTALTMPNEVIQAIHRLAAKKTPKNTKELCSLIKMAI